LDTVAVRVPNHPIALALIRRSGVPIAAPSANRFGHVSPTSARHVLDDLDGRIDIVLDGGPTPIGVESTVLDLTSPRPAILRPGGLAREEIERVIGRLEIRDLRFVNDQMPQASPGTLSKHYAPRAELRIVPDLRQLLHERHVLSARGLKVGLLIQTKEVPACAGLDPQFILGDTTAEIARNLYAGLRALDGDGVDVILVSAVERAGLGEAIADRLQRGTARD
jgi:L-threonylcarbamoyladenylate synthase